MANDIEAETAGIIGDGIAAALRARRERLGWSRETLAHHSGVSWSAIAQIESGRRKDIRLSSLSALASALGVTIEQLVRGRAAGTPAMLDHRVLLYGSEDEYVAGAGQFLVEGIRRCDCLLAVTTAAHARLLRDALGTDSGHVQFADTSDWYRTPQTAVAGYRRFLDDHCDESWLRILGEPAWIGRSPDEVKVWTRYESLINLAFAAAPATIVCAYDTNSPADALTDARHTHPMLHSDGAAVASSSFRHPEDLLLEID
jgi:transcriptional regulator with XRE-family HTH domain